MSADFPAGDLYIRAVFNNSFERCGNAAYNCFDAHRGGKRRFPDHLFRQERHVDKTAFHRLSGCGSYRRKMRRAVAHMVADKRSRIN